MLTKEDIKNLIKAEKEVFVTKTELVDVETRLKQSFSNLQTSVDGLVKTVKDKQEIKVLGHRVDKVETWTRKAAPKVGVEFKH